MGGGQLAAPWTAPGRKSGRYNSMQSLGDCLIHPLSRLQLHEARGSVVLVPTVEWAEPTQGKMGTL